MSTVGRRVNGTRSRLAGLVDDAAIFPPGDAPLHDATAAARRPRRRARYADLVGTFVVRTPTCRWSAASARSHSRSWSPAAPGRSRARRACAASSALAVAGLEIALRDLDDLGRQRPPRRRRGGRCPRRRLARRPTCPSTSSSRPPSPTHLARRGRRGGRGRAPAEVPHRRAGGRELFPAAPTLAALDRRGARPRDAVQVHGGAAPRACGTRATTASSTTASSTCSSRPGRRSTAARVDVAASPRGARARGSRRTTSARRRALVHVVRLVLDRRTARRTSAQLGLVAELPDELTGFGLDHLPYGVFSRRRRASAAWACASATPSSTSPRPRPAGPSSTTRRSTRSWAWVPWSGGRPARPSRPWPPAAPRRRTPSTRWSCTCRSRSPTTSTSTPRSTTPPTSAGCSGRTPSRSPPNWRHLPIGYHGRAGTVVASGYAGGPTERPTQSPHGRGTDLRPEHPPGHRGRAGLRGRGRLAAGRRRADDALSEHVFGVVGLNDWSARDIQAWEYVPLGPFLGKSFATSISALGHAPGRARRRLGGPAGPGPATARLPRPRPRPRARHRRRGGAQRRGREPAEVLLDVLVVRPRCSRT